MDPTIRPARLDDAEAVRAFTGDTWPEHGGDYIPRVFESWVEESDSAAGDAAGGSRTLVADLDGRAVGLLRTTLLTPEEAWCGGLRVDPDRRGRGIARRLVRAGFEWARERGASVARCMVFSWNTAGLGTARAVGFEPVTEFRWAHPSPETEARGSDRSIDDDPDPGAVWSCWRDSAANDHLRGLTLDPGESWALSTLTRERLIGAADEGRLLAVGEDGVRGFAIRVRATTYSGDDEERPERWAEYGVADWANAEAASALFEAISRDAASADADRTRVLIPETVHAVSDAALARVEIADAPDFVLAAGLTGEHSERIRT